MRSASRRRTVAPALARAAAALATATAALAVLGPTAGQASAAATYHSPHYKGLTHRPVVVPTPLPAVTLGTGKDPSVLVDAAGTAHVTFSTDGRRRRPRHGHLLPAAARPEGLRGHLRVRAHGSARRRHRRVRRELPRRQPRLRRTGPAGHRQPARRRRSPLPRRLRHPGRGHLGQQRVPVDLRRRRRDLHRRRPDRQQRDAAAERSSTAARLRRSARSAARRRRAPPSRARAPASTRQASGAARPARPGLRRQPRRRRRVAGRRVRRPPAAPVIVREWSGSGDVNDPATWSTATFAGYAPRLAGGPGGVFVLYRDSISGGNVLVRSISAGQPTGAPVTVDPRRKRDRRQRPADRRRTPPGTSSSAGSARPASRRSARATAQRGRPRS